MITRQEYMSTYDPERGHYLHNEYYDQFVTAGILDHVLTHIGAERIKQSKDIHFNDIPLSNWDGMAMSINRMCRDLRIKCGEGDSLSIGVCIGKAAARRMRGF